MLRRARMRHDNLQHPVQIARAEPRRNLHPEHPLRPVVVLPRPKLHAALKELFLVPHRPPREAPRHVHHVLLRVAAVHAERVQLQQLARIVLVRFVVGLHAPVHPAVEIPQHRRTHRTRPQQLPEIPQRVRPDHIAIIGRLQPLRLRLRGIDIKMVRPKLHHHLVKLPLAQHRPQHRRPREIVQQHLVLEFVQMTHPRPPVLHRRKQLLQRIARIALPRKQRPRRIREAVELMPDHPLAQPVRQCLRRQLLLDKSAHAPRRHPRIVARPHPERQPVDRMRHRIELRRRRRRQRLWQRRRRRFAQPPPRIRDMFLHAPAPAPRRHDRTGPHDQKLSARHAHGVVTGAFSPRPSPASTSAPNPASNVSGSNTIVP